MNMSDKENYYRIMDIVTAALSLAGYDPRSQLAEYVRTGNLAYITRRNNARQLIASLDRTEVRAYMREEGMI